MIKINSIPIFIFLSNFKPHLDQYLTTKRNICYEKKTQNSSPHVPKYLAIKLMRFSHPCFCISHKLSYVLPSLAHTGLTMGWHIWLHTQLVIPCLSISHSWPKLQLSSLHWLRPVRRRKRIVNFGILAFWLYFDCILTVFWNPTAFWLNSNLFELYFEEDYILFA